MNKFYKVSILLSFLLLNSISNINSAVPGANEVRVAMQGQSPTMGSVLFDKIKTPLKLGFAASVFIAANYCYNKYYDKKKTRIDSIKNLAKKWSSNGVVPMPFYKNYIEINKIFCLAAWRIDKYPTPAHIFPYATKEASDDKRRSVTEIKKSVIKQLLIDIQVCDINHVQAFVFNDTDVVSYKSDLQVLSFALENINNEIKKMYGALKDLPNYKEFEKWLLKYTSKNELGQLSSLSADEFNTALTEFDKVFKKEKEFIEGWNDEYNASFEAFIKLVKAYARAIAFSNLIREAIVMPKVYDIKQEYGNDYGSGLGGGNLFGNSRPSPFSRDSASRSEPDDLFRALNAYRQQHHHNPNNHTFSRRADDDDSDSDVKVARDSSDRRAKLASGATMVSPRPTKKVDSEKEKKSDNDKPAKQLTITSTATADKTAAESLRATLSSSPDQT